MSSPRKLLGPATVLFVTTLASPACGDDGKHLPGEGPAKSSFRGTLTLAREGPNDPFNANQVIDLDLATNQSVVRFDGFDAQRTRAGETAYITRLAAGYVADAGIVSADARGVTRAPVHVCRMFSHTSNRVCHTPKLSPDGRTIAFGIADGGGQLCQNNYGLFWADYVVVRDHQGRELGRFEGYFSPEWLPDGRLLMLGSACRGAGVWIAPRGLGQPTRVDGKQLGTPAAQPAVSPDGRQVALVWNGQLWRLRLDGAAQLEQLTRSAKPVASAAWSPDGEALAVLLWDVTMPLKLVWLFRPGDGDSGEVRNLPFYPFGPISWN